jgi:hypothetical protein
MFVMRLFVIVLVFGTIFGILFLMGMAVGYYYALSVVGKIELLALGAFGFAFLTWVGSGVDLVGLLRDWYKEKKEAERQPSLNQGVLIFTESRNLMMFGEEYDTKTYYITLTKIKGEGQITDCHVLIDIPDHRIRNSPLIWRKTHREFISIDIEEDIEIFRVTSYRTPKPTQILFWVGQQMDFPMPREYEYDIFVNSKITIKSGASYGIVPKPFSMTVGEIVAKAVKGA